MARIVHARIDDQTERLLAKLERRLGWNDSQVIREGIKALNILLVPNRRDALSALAGFDRESTILARIRVI